METIVIAGGRKGDCVETVSLNRHPGGPARPVYPVGPIGAEGDEAMAVLRVDARETELYLLKRQGGKWLVDCPCVTPDPKEAHGNSEQAKAALAAIKHYEAVVSEPHPHYVGALALGDLALVYDEFNEGRFLSKTKNGWRVTDTFLPIPY